MDQGRVGMNSGLRVAAFKSGFPLRGKLGRINGRARSFLRGESCCGEQRSKTAAVMSLKAEYRKVGKVFLSFKSIVAQRGILHLDDSALHSSLKNPTAIKKPRSQLKG